MNLRAFVIGIFRGFSAADGELDAIRETARADARQIVGTYVQEFRAEAARVFHGGQQALLGVDEPVDVEPVATCAGRPAPHGRRRRAAVA